MQSVDWVLCLLQCACRALLFFFGASFFSFLNVIVYRMPRGISVVRGHSKCTACGKQLRAWDEVPLLSWLCLRGKCHWCGARISPRYFWMECAGGALALACVRGYGTPAYGLYAPTIAAVLVFAACAILVAIALIDADTQLISNRFLAALLLCGVLACVVFPQPDLWARLAGAVCVSLPMLLLSLAIVGAFGGGDIKLMAVAGFFLGWRLCAVAFFLAVMAGGAYGAVLKLRMGKDCPQTIAFAPFLCGGCMTVLLLSPVWGV